MSTGYGPSVVTNGIVAWVDAANPRSYPGSGSNWYDLSGNNNNGILTNSPTYNASGVSSSFSFNGSNNYVNLGTSPSLNIAGAITLDVWVNASTYSGVELLLGNWISSSKQNYGLFWSDTGGSYHGLEFIVGPGGSTGLSTNPFANGSWHNVAATYSGSQLALYVDGGQVSQTVSTQTPNNTTTDWHIGGGNGVFYFTGMISVAKIYNRALSTSEVAQNFEALRGRYGI